MSTTRTMGGSFSLLRNKEELNCSGCADSTQTQLVGVKRLAMVERVSYLPNVLVSFPCGWDTWVEGS